MSDEQNSGIEHWIEQTSAFDRVRSVAFSLQHPQTAGQIAGDAHVSDKTARNHLTRLVEMDIVLEKGGEGPTTYYPDPGYMRYRETRSLARDHDRDELIEIVATLKGDIENWMDTFGVDTPDDLRASVADTEVAESEIYEGQTIAEDWDYTQYRLGLVKDALAQYERLTVGSSAIA